MDARTVPSRQFLNKIRDALMAGASDTKLISVKIKPDVDALTATLQDLENSVNVQERKRPTTTGVDGRYLEMQITLETKIDESRRRYHADFMAREEALNKIETELAELHDKIEEKQNDAAVKNLKNLVTDNKLHLNLEEKMEEQRLKLLSRGCFASFFSCCMASDEKLAESRINQLSQKKAKLNSTNPKEVHEAATDILSEERDKLIAERAAIEAKAPIRMDDSAEDKSSAIDREVKLKEKKFYFAITNESMFYVIKANTLFQKILLDLKLQPKIVPTSSTPLISPNQKLLELFSGIESDINDLFSHFWCPFSYNSKASDIVERMSSLADKDCETIFAKKLIDTIVPYQETEYNMRDFIYFAGTPTASSASETATLRVR